MKRKEKYAIRCRTNWGPTFGCFDIHIDDFCNKEDSCWINNDGTHGYKCHPQYKSSLFVETDQCDESIKFSVFDYEVYAINCENKYCVYNTCKYPDIIWNYIQTKDISEETLNQFRSEDELRDDLDSIYCNDIAIRLKISQYYFKNPSQFLPNTQIVDQQYDSYLRKWIGNKQTELLYRASEYNYTFESFHECCDDYDHLLVIIKSNGGWIFGGYTSMSWKVNNSNGKGCILLYFPLIV